MPGDFRGVLGVTGSVDGRSELTQLEMLRNWTALG
jgi:hypothetical protein